MVGVSPTLAIYFYLVLWQSGYMQRSFKPYKVGSTPTGTTSLGRRGCLSQHGHYKMLNGDK
jgi:hypothetical protein